MKIFKCDLQVFLFKYILDNVYFNEEIWHDVCHIRNSLDFKINHLFKTLIQKSISL